MNNPLPLVLGTVLVLNFGVSIPDVAGVTTNAARCEPAEGPLNTPMTAQAQSSSVASDADAEGWLECIRKCSKPPKGSRINAIADCQAKCSSTFEAFGKARTIKTPKGDTVKVIPTAGKRVIIAPASGRPNTIGVMTNVASNDPQLVEKSGAFWGVLSEFTGKLLDALNGGGNSTSGKCGNVTIKVEGDDNEIGDIDIECGNIEED